MKVLIPIFIGLLVVGCGKKEVKTSPKIAPNKLITDPIVEKVIREELKKHTGELTEADLKKVTWLDLYNKQLTDVKGLEKLTQLELLYLNGNQLTSVKGLVKLAKLKELYLHGNQLTKLPEGLEKLTQLEMLNLSNNKLTDVKGLENLTKLKELYLYDNKLTDVKGLVKLGQLKDLDFENNPDLTKVQIDELQKALPKCKIIHDTKK